MQQFRSEFSARPDSSVAVVFFRGSAREAAARYALNANVTVVTALSGIGLDKTTVELVSDLMIRNNRHEIQAMGDFGSLTITIENRPLQSNPKSSELAARSTRRDRSGGVRPMSSADIGDGDWSF